MRVSKYWHSCLLVEEGDTRILIDPGKYSFLPGRAKPENFKNLTAILITHEHGDHADPQALKKIHARNPVPIYGNAGVQKTLQPFGLEVEILENGETRIGRMQVEAIPAEHGNIIRGTPPNTAFILDGALLVPGDSHARILRKQNVRAVALPIISPWGKMEEAYEVAEKIRPKFILPVHDGFVREDFLEGQYEHWNGFCADLGVDFRPLRTPQEFLEV